jgi:hypothetical protein
MREDFVYDPARKRTATSIGRLEVFHPGGGGFGDWPAFFWASGGSKLYPTCAEATLLIAAIDLSQRNTMSEEDYARLGIHNAIEQVLRAPTMRGRRAVAEIEDLLWIVERDARKAS